MIYALRVPVIMDVTPVLQVKDVQASVAFYRDKLGFGARYQEQRGLAIVQRDGTDIILTAANDDRWRTRSDLAERPVVTSAESFLPGTGSCRIRVEGIEELYAAYQAAGVIHRNGPLRDQWWGVREFGVGDLDGNALTFFQTAATTKAQVDATSAKDAGLDDPKRHERP